ncbi:hypothetical protein Hdeb2414_s1169g00987751 [Helianthus debilis subsp. tardiflorus]
MSAHEDTLDLDDDNHSNGHANISVGVNKKLGASVLANNGVSTKFALPESKKGAISPGSSVVNNQKIGFYVPALTSSSSTQSTVLSQPTSVVDTVKVTPPNKPTVFPTFGMVKANVSPDAKQPLGATSLNNDNGKSQKPENVFGNSGSSSSAIPTTASANGVYSFGVSTNNSAIINGTSSSPSIFASSFSFQSFGTNTNNVSSSSSSTVLSSTTTTTAVSSTFATSVSASAFSFGSATASSTTLSNGGSIFGFSSPSATLTANGSQANTQAAFTAVTQAVPFKFGSGTSETPSSASAGSLFSSSAPSFGLTSVATSSGGSTSSSTTMFSSGSSATPSFGLSSTVASSETKSGGSGFGSTLSFGVNSTVASSETKSASNVFGSTPFFFGASTMSMPSASSWLFMFGSSNAGASTGSSLFSFSSKLSSPAPVFGTSPPSNTDQMSMEDSMADDSNQTPSPAPAFGQASSGTPPGFMFGSVTPTTVQPPGFLFGAQINQPQAPSQSPFPATQFSAGGRFSLGSGGGDNKSNRS